VEKADKALDDLNELLQTPGLTDEQKANTIQQIELVTSIKELIPLAEEARIKRAWEDHYG